MIQPMKYIYGNKKHCLTELLLDYSYKHTCIQKQRLKNLESHTKIRHCKVQHNSLIFQLTFGGFQMEPTFMSLLSEVTAYMALD